MLKRLTLAALALAVGLSAPLASANVASGGSTTSWCPVGQQGVAGAYAQDLGTNGYVGWAAHSEVSAYHASGASCALGAYWPEVNVDIAQRVDRLTYGGWITCALTFGSGVGFATIDTNSAAVGDTGLCASTSYPDGWTRTVMSFTLHVSGAAYSFGPNSATTVTA